MLATFRVLPWLALCGVLLVAGPARAHFVWAVVQTTGGVATAELYFSEAAEAESAELIGKIAHSDAWLRRADGGVQPLKLAEVSDGVIGRLSAAIDRADGATLEAVCRYGVITKREPAALLTYYAKWLPADPKVLAARGRSEQLALDIVPRRTDSGLRLTALWQGAPAADAEVVIVAPAGRVQKLVTDSQGVATLAELTPGLYSIRVRHERAAAGEHEGQAYERELHYATLALAVDSAADTPATASSLMKQARDARAVWEDFPGFTAELAIATAAGVERGQVRVSRSGEVTLTGCSEPAARHTLPTLRSLVSHRLPGDENNDDVSLADKQADHPLGRLIKLDYDNAMASHYRVAGDVIAQVNRQMEGGRFTISVLDVHRNPAGKYLPQTYTVTFWNKDGSVRSTSTVRDAWVRVGEFDLPAEQVTVTAGGDDKYDVRRLTFSSHALEAAAGQE